MITGACGGVRVIVERLSSSLHGVRRAYPASIPRSLCAHCLVADGVHLGSLCPPLNRHTAQAGSELVYVPQREYLSLKREGGVEVWTTMNAFSGEAQVGRRKLIDDIAEAVNSTDETVAQREERGLIGGIEATAREDGDPGSGFNIDLIEGMKNLTRRAEVLREEVMSFDYSVSPTPYSPIEGPEAVNFAVISVGLLFIFWLGNYFVPDLIFKDTVFRNNRKNSLDTTSEDNKLAGSSEQATESNVRKDDAQSSMSRTVGTGFGQRKQKRVKDMKRK